MKTVLPADIDLGSVHSAVGPEAWAAAHRALAERVGGQVIWRPADSALQGYLQASDGFFETTIHLTPGRLLRFGESCCTCWRGANCEHAATLTLAAAEACGQDITARSSPAWERSLAALLPGGNAGSSGVAGRPMLAVEVSLRNVRAARRPTEGRDPRPPTFVLDARLVQPGKNGTWVAGQLGWSKLDLIQHYGGYDPEHIRLLKELYSTYLSGDGAYGSDQRYIDLARFESRHLWPLLEEAAAIGLPLIYPRTLGRLPECGTAEVCLDVTGAERPGDLLIRPVIRVNGATGDIVPVRFVGSTGHGVVYADRVDVERNATASDWRFGLARFGRRTARELQDLVLAGAQLTVPAEEKDRFRGEYYPRLRQAATVISSDRSFTPPVISEPTLMLAADYGPGHTVDVSFAWLYQVAESRLRTPLEAASASADAGYRDATAERAILESMGAQLERFGLADAGLADAGDVLGADVGGRARIGPTARLTGLDTMRFSTELLPLLSGQPGLDIEISGEPADYREASDSVRIGVSTDEIAGEHDWFDLGVTIAVDGQDVPFAAVFMALSRGDSHLLLDDGAYFSLDKPELQALARLIEEARTLADWPGSQLRISRFQADLWGELAALGLVERQAAAWQRQVDGLLSLTGRAEIGETQPPAMLTAHLRPYQLAGFQWLAFLWANRLGGILADDMGLGKTLQALALICHAREAEPDAPPFLIVAPTSVVSNWTSEAARFAPGLKVAAITETMARRGADLPQLVSGIDAVVTTYALLRIDAARYSSLTWSG
ncbi:MAG: SNF2-related protein, partial [Streptosporangiaceae bacterium]